MVNSAPNADISGQARRLIDNAEGLPLIDPRVQNSHLTSLGDVVGLKLFQICG